MSRIAAGTALAALASLAGVPAAAQAGHGDSGATIRFESVPPESTGIQMVACQWDV